MREGLRTQGTLVAVDLKQRGLIDDFRHMELERLLGDLYGAQTRCEGIKDYPFPRQYASANFYFVWTFLALLPFAMLGVFGASLRTRA